MSELTLPAVYRRAIEIIEERGWWGAGWMPPGGDPTSCPVCLLAAVGLAIGGTLNAAPLVSGPVFAYGDQIRLYNEAWVGLRAVTVSLPGVWNDMSGRDVDQIRAVLLRAAEEAERRG